MSVVISTTRRESRPLSSERNKMNSKVPKGAWKSMVRNEERSEERDERGDGRTRRCGRCAEESWQLKFPRGSHLWILGSLNHLGKKCFVFSSLDKSNIPDTLAKI